MQDGEAYLRETPSSPEMPDLDKMSKGQILTLLSGIMLGLFLAALDQTIIATALPAISHDLGQIQEVPWVATSYLLASTISVPMFGKIGDLFGRKRLFQFAIWTFLAGSVLCGMSQTMSQLIVGRVIQGIGAGGLLTIPATILGDVVSPRNRGRYLGYIGVVWALASIAGPSVGGILTQEISWRWVFYINVPIGAAAVVATTLFLNLPRLRSRHKIDYIGGALLAATSSCALLALISMGSANANQASIGSLLVLSAIFLLAFIAQEHRAPEPLLPLQLFKNPVMRVGIVLSLLVGVGMFITITYAPMYLQLSLDHSVSGSGFLLSPMLLTLVITTFTTGRLISASGHYRIYPIVGTLLLSVGFIMVAISSEVLNEWLIVSATVVIALGIGCIMQVVVLAIQNSVAHAELGVATSTERLFRSLGAAVGVAIAGVILALHLVDLPDRAESRSGSRAIERFLSGAETGDLVTEELPGEAGTLLGDEVGDAMRSIFLAALPLSITGFLVSLRLEQLPLRHGPNYAARTPELVGE